MPLTDTLPLTESERASVEARLQIYDRRIGIACIALFVGILVPCITVEVTKGVMLYIALPIWFVGFPALGLWARDGHVRAGLLRRDLRDAVVAVHEGDRDRFILDQVAWQLVQDRKIDATTIEIRVLPQSNLLLNLQGHLVSGWHVLPESQVIESPPIRWKAFANISATQADARPRDLTAAEREEIERYRSALIRMTWVEVALIAWAGMAALSWALDLDAHWLTRLVALALGGGVVVRFLGRLRRFFLLKRDLKLGQLVVIVAQQTDCELLPGSQSLWTVNGQPAPWRGVKPRPYKG